MTATGLAFDETGPEDGPILLLIHPMGADRRFWDGCRATWAGRLRSVAIDLRGAGDSPVPDHALRPEDHAADIERFRVEQGLDRVIPVGCAVGAMIAATYAGMYPTACNALVLSNPGFQIGPEARGALAKRAAKVRDEGMISILPETLDIAFDSLERHPLREEFERTFVAQDAAGYALQIEGMLNADVSPHMEALVMPVLLVAGARDRLLPTDHARAIAREVKGSELVVLDQGAHFIPYQLPDDFAEIVDRFVSNELSTEASGC